VKSIRSICKAPIILGGSAFSLFPKEIAAYLEADGGIRGEGEDAAGIFQELSHGQIAENEPMNMTEVVFPKNIHEMFPGFRRYKTLGIQTARGCPNKCIYCTYPSLEGSSRRTRTAESVVADITMLYKDFGINSFFFVDSLFNGDEDHMARVLEKLSEKSLPVRFSCYMQPKMSDSGIFRLLKKAGCVAVDFGTDSGSPAMLAAFRKPFAPDDISAASEACRRAGIDFCHSLIFGGPGETAGTIAETVSLMDTISPRAVIAMTGIRILPGTGMVEIAIRDGQIDADDNLLYPKFYIAPGLLQDDLIDRIESHARSHSNWIVPGLGIRSDPTLLAALRRNGHRGPLWDLL